MLSYYTAVTGVSPYERHYHSKPLVDRFWDKVAIPESPESCWLWTGGLNYGDHGYGVFGLADRSVGAHRFSWELHFGPIPEELWVLHSCDNPPCVSPFHLFLGTNSDNCRDSVRKGRWGDRRAKVRGHKLTIEQVRQIKETLLGEHWRGQDADLASQWGVSRILISQIRRGKTWVL